MTTLDDAIAQLEEFGLDVGGVPVADGKVHRCNYQGERKRSGWYVLHQDVDLFYGSYGSWKVREEGFNIMRRNAAALDSNKYKQLKDEMMKKSRSSAGKPNERRRPKQQSEPSKSGKAAARRGQAHTWRGRVALLTVRDSTGRL